MPNNQTNNGITIPESRRERKRLLRAFPGLIRDVARRTRHHRSHVSNVFHGLDTSAPVTRAIMRELERRSQVKEMGA